MQNCTLPERMVEKGIKEIVTRSRGPPRSPHNIFFLCLADLTSALLCMYVSMYVCLCLKLHIFFFTEK